MRILFVNDYYLLGGAEVIMHSLTKSLRSAGATVCIAAPDASEIQDNFRLSRISGRVGLPLRHSVLFNYDPRVGRSLSNLLRSIHPDVVHCHNLWRLSLAPMVSAVRWRVPTVVTIHDYWPVCLNRALLQDGEICEHSNWARGLPGCRFRWYDSAFRPFVERGMLTRRRILSDPLVTLVAVSDYVKKVLVRFGYRASGIRVIRNGVDLSEFGPAAGARRERLALFLGGLHWVKGFSDFCSAANRVRRRLPDARFLALGVDSKEAFGAVEVRGKVARSEQLQLLHRASCVVLPSIWPEPFPTVALEALACGTPVVAYDVGGISEIVEGGKTGFLVARREVEDLAERIQYLLEDPTLVEEMGVRGRFRVEESFSLGRMVDEYRVLYEGVAGSR